MSEASTEVRPDKSDRTGLYVTSLLGVLAAVGVVGSAIARLAVVVPGRAVPVSVSLDGETVSLPIGGVEVPVEVEQGIVLVSEPAGWTLFALVAEPIIQGLALLGGIALLVLFCWNVARGYAFEPRTVRLVITGAILAGVSWVALSILDNIVVNGTLTAFARGAHEGFLFRLDGSILLGILALGAVGVAFQIGERLRRDTRGLI